jgi:hypothetical protein
MDIKVNLGLNNKQKEVYQSNAQYIVFPAGRRFGKGEFAVRWQFTKICNIETEPDYIHAWVAPSYRQAKLGFYKTLRFYKKNKIPHKENNTDLFIDVINDKHRVQFFGVDKPQYLEGYGFKSVVIDEAGITLKKETIWHNTIAPACMDFNAYIFFTGTPKGKGLYYELYNKGKNKEHGYESFKASTFDNTIENGGYIQKESIENMIKQLPEEAIKQEIYAEFLEDGWGVFRNIKNCIKGTLEKANPAKQYYCGIDLAKVDDFTVISILDQNGHLVFFDRFNKNSWPIMKARIIKDIELYKPYCLIDSTGIGNPIFDDLSLHISLDAFIFTNLSKAQIITELSVGMEKEEISFPEIPELIDELEYFEATVLGTGNIRYAAPLGLHDDCVMALALAYHAFNQGRGRNNSITDIEGRIMGQNYEW